MWRRTGTVRRWTITLLAAGLAASAPGLAQNAPFSLPEIATVQALDFEEVVSNFGWHLIGRVPEGYRIGTGAQKGMTGVYARFLQACGTTALSGFGALERTFPGEEYAGKRVRMSGHIRNDGNGLVTFYFQALDESGQILRGIRRLQDSNTDWQGQELVMDVPAAATALEVGITLQGSRASTVWLDNLVVAAVDRSVSTKGDVMQVTYQREIDKPVVSCDGEKF